jgi:hypothetical protein
MVADRRRDIVAGSALTAGGLGLAARPDLPGAQINRFAANRAHRRFAAIPDPATMSGKHGGRRRDAAGNVTGRGPSARATAQARWNTEGAQLARKLAKPPVRGKVGTALRIGSGAAGIGGVWAGTGMIGRGLDQGHRQVSKAGVDTLNSQDLVGIAPWRKNPVDPLTMASSSKVMADVLVQASGRKLSRRERKAVSRGAYRFVGAQHMVVVPTGMKGLVTA